MGSAIHQLWARWGLITTRAVDSVGKVVLFSVVYVYARVCQRENSWTVWDIIVNILWQQGVVQARMTSKMAAFRCIFITFSSACARPIILVSLVSNIFAKFRQSNPRMGALNTGWVVLKLSMFSDVWLIIMPVLVLQSTCLQLMYLRRLIKWITTGCSSN